MPLQRCRKRRIACFNLPFSMQAKADIAGTFLKLIDECFLVSHFLRSSFNRNTI